MGIKEVRCEGVDWIHLALEESSGRLLMNHWVPQKARNSLTILVGLMETV
jgi:hypothetical protein